MSTDPARPFFERRGPVRAGCALLLGLFGLRGSASALGRDDQPCDLPLVAQALAQPLAVKFPDGENPGEVIAIVCKGHPQRRDVTIVALFHVLVDQRGEQRDDVSGFVAALVDAKRRVALSLYRATVEGDASIRVGGGSLWLDTARYDLAPGVRAFGVRMDIGYSPRCAEGGTSQYLSLFVPDGNRLRPVVQSQPTQGWQVLEWDTDANSGACTQARVDTTTLSFALRRSATNGWRDLDLIATTEPGAAEEQGTHSRRLKTSTARLATLRYDGLRYGAAAPDAELGLMSPWPELLRPWIP